MMDRDGNAGWQGLQLDFVLVNQAESPPGSKPRRAYLSCERCRKRKTRCELPSGDGNSCKRCSTDNQLCEFRASRRTKRKLPLPRQDAEPFLHHHTGSDIVFSDSASIEPRDSLYPPTNREEYTSGIPIADSSQGPSDTATLDARIRLISSHMHNASDALDLLTLAATRSQDYDSPSAMSGGSNLISSATPPGAASNPPHNLERACKSFIRIRKGILSQTEVMQYLDFFFERLWPLKPVVPAYYCQRSTYAQLIDEEPLLVMCLVTLSSRYFPLPGHHGEIRSERIHWQSWKILQRSLQSVLWGSTITRSLGAIAAMLLLIDWHVKAINNPTDFTEGEEGAGGYMDDHVLGFKSTVSDTDSLAGQQRYGMINLMEKLNIVSPAYRSNKMAWILLSNAIALAHEGCCFQTEWTSSSLGSLSSLDLTKKEWNRLICVFIYLADEGLATRLGLEPLLPEKSRQIVRDQFATTFAESLPHSTLWESYFELSIETQKAREFLHSLKAPGALVSDPNLVARLEHLRQVLNRWRRQYYHQNNVDLLSTACLHMEFHYITLFCFAPAAQAVQNGHRAVSTETIEALSEFESQATQASHALLSIVVDVLKPSELTQYLPVRCWLFIVAGSLHLLKATLSKSQNVTRSHPNIQLILNVIDVVHNGSPDDAHMAIRYAKFLAIMVQTTLPMARDSPNVMAGEELMAPSGNGGGLTMEDGFGEVTFPTTSDNLTVEGVGDDMLHLELDPDPFTWWESMHAGHAFPFFYNA